MATSVSAAVEKMVASAPPVTTGAEADPAKAPVKTTPVQKETDPSEAVNADGTRTAFEQELIDSLDGEDRTEFDAATPAEQKRQVAFMKREYRKSAKQMTELGTLRKAIGTLRDSGVTNEDLLNLIKSKRNGSAAPAEKPAEGKRAFNRWREQAKDSAEREALTEAEQVVTEQIEDVVRALLEKEVKPLRDRLEAADRQQHSERGQNLEQEIHELEDKHGYPGSLIETHREGMLQLGRREPSLSAEDLLVRVAGFQVVKAAMLKTVTRAEKPPVVTARLGSPIVKKPEQAMPERNSRGRASISKFVTGLLTPKH